MARITNFKLKGNRRFKRRLNKTKTNRIKHPAPSLIHNLSKHTLNKEQIKLLNKGMNFCPAPKPKNIITKYDLHKFRKKLRNQVKYGDTDPEEKKPFVKPSNYSPKKSNEILETFADKIDEYTLRKLYNTKSTTTHTHPPILTNTIKSLLNLTDTTFKRADKSGKLVILDTADYLKESYRQLEDRNCYAPQIFDPTHITCEKIEKILLKMKIQKIISTANYKYLIPAEDTKTPVFYHIPKIHKPLKQGIHPGRPIISACNGPLKGIAQYIDYHLNPILQKSTTYIKNSTHLLQEIQEIRNINKNTFLITADVVSLYTSIPHREIIRAVTLTLEARQTPHNPPTNTILELVNFLLNNTFFEFNEVIYQQIKGVPMGSCASPTLACLFMVHFEQAFLQKQIIKPIYFGRFIDDVFIIANDTYQQIISFLHNMNNEQTHTKFTWSISKKQAIFLDLRIYKEQQSDNSYTLVSDLFEKKTNIHQYLHYESSHPKHVFKSIIFSQALRIIRIVHDKKNLTHRLRTLAYNLGHRGYPKEFIKQQINKALNTPITNNYTNTINHNKNKHIKRAPLVITYNRQLDNLGSFMHQLFHTVQEHPIIKKQIPQPPIVAFKKPKNLGNLFIHSQYREYPLNIKPVTHNRRCKMCPQLAHTHTLQSTVNSETIQINQTLKCTSPNVIYAIICTKCKQIYIGETGLPLNIRFTQHRYYINLNTPTTPVAKHFQSTGHTKEHVSITPIKQITNPERRKNLEKKYINLLQTKYPFGINYTPVPKK